MKSEIEWTDSPAPVAPGGKPDLIRCGLGSLPPLIVISDRHIGTELHFWQGRSFPHLKDGCPACAAKNVATWKGYVGTWNPATRLTGILEFTLGCVSAFDAWFLARGTCRGATIILKRAGTKPNGKLSAILSPSQWGLDQLPPTPNIREQMQMMWGAKRVEQFIDTNPQRAVVEPPADTAEVMTRRNQHAATAGGVDTSEATMKLGDVSRLLAERLTLGSIINGKAGTK